MARPALQPRGRRGRHRHGDPVLGDQARRALTDAAVDRWDAWTPAEAAARLAGVEAPWYVAAGWAIDLFLGGQRREHEDLEIAVPAARFGELAAALAPLEPLVPGADDDGRSLVQPVTHAWFEERHQTWFRDAGGAWRVDVFREPHDGDTWLCRRDESIRLPYSEVILRTAAGIPYARPEIVLLFKAKHAREKDTGDLEAALPRLDRPARTRLRDWLELVHPGHAWLERV